MKELGFECHANIAADKCAEKCDGCKPGDFVMVYIYLRIIYDKNNNPKEKQFENFREKLINDGIFNNAWELSFAFLTRKYCQNIDFHGLKGIQDSEYREQPSHQGRYNGFLPNPKDVTNPTATNPYGGLTWVANADKQDYFDEDQMIDRRCCCRNQPTSD